jgi:hypothetical protein
MRIIPHSSTFENRFAHEFVLVSVRFLGDVFLRQLSERNLIEGLRFSADNSPQTGKFRFRFNRIPAT